MNVTGLCAGPMKGSDLQNPAPSLGNLSRFPLRLRRVAVRTGSAFPAGQLPIQLVFRGYASPLEAQPHTQEKQKGGASGKAEPFRTVPAGLLAGP
jgi:hypothetical protein